MIYIPKCSKFLIVMYLSRTIEDLWSYRKISAKFRNKKTLKFSGKNFGLLKKFLSISFMLKTIPTKFLNFPIIFRGNMGKWISQKMWFLALKLDKRCNKKYSTCQEYLCLAHGLEYMSRNIRIFRLNSTNAWFLYKLCNFTKKNL